jgi:uncharacterized protein DUF2752
MTGIHKKYSPYTDADRNGYLAVTFVSALTIVIARLLHPSPRGVGTHEQLGLPPCPFLLLTGIPCPSCGLTTSFAFAAKLDFLSSLTIQPFGLIAFCLTFLAIPISIFLIRRRISWHELMPRPNFDRLIYLMIAFYILSWFYKIIIWRS